MKVLLVNGSPHAHGCTYTALAETAKVFNAAGIDTEIFQLGTKPISGCIACGACRKTGRCAIDDVVNEFLMLAPAADGFIFGSPVHYSGASGAITSFMDRAFYAGKREFFEYKPAACVTSARRSGTTATFDQLNKYFAIAEMPIMTSCYWNNVHGNTPEEVMQDEEGLLVMRTLARNMIWFLRCKQAGIDAGVPFPESEPRVKTNFIR